MESKIKVFIVLLLTLVLGNIVFATEAKPQIIWDITIKSHEIKGKLETVTPVTQYDGSIVNVPYNNAPASGNVYLLINMEVNKTAGGDKTFIWKNLNVIDGQGGKWGRVENDNFLQDHGYNRMRGDDLKLGKNDGFVCFEIPQDKASVPLSLEYEFNGEKKIVDIK